jgi:hypothetical protein
MRHLMRRTNVHSVKLGNLDDGKKIYAVIDAEFKSRRLSMNIDDIKSSASLSTLDQVKKTISRPVSPSFDMLPIIKSPQEYAFLTLIDEIKRFESELEEDEVVAALLASFGKTVNIQIHTIKQVGQFFCIEGNSSEGNKATLLQHYTQASFLLLKAQKQPDEVKRPIGFL